MGSRKRITSGKKDDAVRPEDGVSLSARRVGQPDRTFIDAWVVLKIDQHRIQGVACDVSENGIKIVTDELPELGPVSVKLVGLPTVSGVVCWRAASHVGVRLSNPLEPDVLANWIRYHGSARR